MKKYAALIALSLSALSLHAGKNKQPGRQQVPTKRTTTALKAIKATHSSSDSSSKEKAVPVVKKPSALSRLKSQDPTSPNAIRILAINEIVPFAQKYGFRNNRHSIEAALKQRSTIEIITKKPHHAYDIGLQNQLPELWENVAHVILAGFKYAVGQHKGYPVVKPLQQAEQLLLAELAEQCLENEYELYCAAERLGVAPDEFNNLMALTRGDLKSFNQRMISGKAERVEDGNLTIEEYMEQ